MKVLARGGRSRALAAIAVLATIALVAAGASPAEAVPIKRGDTKLVLDPNIFPVLDAQGIAIFRSGLRSHAMAASGSRSLAAA
jgi:hypothetical protein